MTEVTPEDVAFELALLQFTYDPSSEERVNVGVVAYSPTTGEIVSRFSERYGALKFFYPSLSGSSYRSILRNLSARARTVAKTGSRGKQLALDRPEGVDAILQQIAPAGSMNFAWSSVRYGICRSIRQKVDETFGEFVGLRESRGARERRDDEAVWRRVTSEPTFEEVTRSLRTDVEVSTQDYRYVFRAGWRNGRLHVVEPISLDYVDPGDMVEEATRWRGRLDELSIGNDFLMTAILSDPPVSASRRQYDQANHVLERDPRIRAIFRESQVQEFVNLVKSDLASQT